MDPIKTQIVVVGAGPGGYAAAFYAADLGKKVILVERFIQGQDFRFLVVGNKVVAAARRQAPAVIGNGRHSVAELILSLHLQSGARLAGLQARGGCDELYLFVGRHQLDDSDFYQDSTALPGGLQ